MRSRRGSKEQKPDPFKDEQPAGYHYDRQDRLSRATAPRFRERGGGIFLRNRALLIILLDLVIVMVLGVFLVRFLYARVNRAELEGYSVELRGLRTEEVVLATVTIANTGAISAAQQSVFVRFSLMRNPAEEDSIYVSGSAPPEQGGRELSAQPSPSPAPRPLREFYMPRFGSPIPGNACRRVWSLESRRRHRCCG